MTKRKFGEARAAQDHLTELLDESAGEAYSEATCSEPDARLMQVAPPGDMGPGGVAGPQSHSLRAVAQALEGTDPRGPQPGVFLFGHWGEPGVPPATPPPG